MSTCKDCLYFGRCDASMHYNEPACGCFKDRTLFVKLPCKVGDTFFVLLESSDILEYKVFYINIFCGEVYDEIKIVLDRNYHRIGYTKERFEYELGKTLFSTKEEAEKALKERENRVRHHTGFSC